MFIFHFYLFQVWDLFQNKDIVRDMIVSKIQEESLRTYLFTYSSVYDTLSLVTLAEMFELDVYKVHSIISKMVINEELMVGTFWKEKRIFKNSSGFFRGKCYGIDIIVIFCLQEILCSEKIRTQKNLKNCLKFYNNRHLLLCILYYSRKH